jgi:predicted PurR-regulated permease PerM
MSDACAYSSKTGRAPVALKNSHRHFPDFMSVLPLTFSARLAYSLISITLILFLLYIGQHIIIPLLLALLFAVLLRPLVRFFHSRLRFPHVIAVLVSVILFIALIGGIVVFVSWQVNGMANDWDKIEANLNIHYHNFQHWVRQQYDLSYKEQNQYIEKATTIDGKTVLGSTLQNFSGRLVNLLLTFFYTFLFLLYRNLFIRFLGKLFALQHQKKLMEIMMQVKVAIQSFLIGLMIEMGIVATLTTIGLMIVGVPYAILLGVITGILNMIPYIGILVAALLAIVAALINSTDASMIFGVIVVNIGVQLIDNNILVPMIVSSKVRINALVSMVAIVVGGAIAGISGMFLAIPMIAILKVIFDRIDFLEPWGYLFGDILPKTTRWRKIKLPSFDAGDGKEIQASADK